MYTNLKDNEALIYFKEHVLKLVRVYLTFNKDF